MKFDRLLTNLLTIALIITIWYVFSYLPTRAYRDIAVEVAVATARAEPNYQVDVVGPTFDVNAHQAKVTQAAETVVAMVQTVDAGRTAHAPQQPTPTLAPVTGVTCYDTLIVSQPVDDPKYVLGMMPHGTTVQFDSRSPDWLFVRLFNTYNGPDRVDAWIPTSALCIEGGG